MSPETKKAVSIKLDPITLSVIQAGLQQVCDEMDLPACEFLDCHAPVTEALKAFRYATVARLRQACVAIIWVQAEETRRSPAAGWCRASACALLPGMEIQ